MTPKQLRRAAIAVMIVMSIATVTVLAINATGVMSGSLTELKASDRLILYSLDGRSFPSGKEPQTAENFYDVPVLGKIEIADAKVREKIITTLRRSVSRPDAPVAACFWPRHGIRTITGGNTVDLVICFECSRVHVYREGAETSEPILPLSRELLNSILTDAGIPIAPDGGIGQ